MNMFLQGKLNNMKLLVKNILLLYNLCNYPIPFLNMYLQGIFYKLMLLHLNISPEDMHKFEEYVPALHCLQEEEPLEE